MNPSKPNKSATHNRYLRRRSVKVWIGVILGLFAVSCDFNLLESPSLPKWSIALTMPLVNRSYSMAESVNNSTIFADSLTDELQVEFEGALDTTEIDPNFLEITLPAGATPDPINETVDAPDAAALFSSVAESVVVTIALDDLLVSTGLPIFSSVSFPQAFDFPIDSADWNSIVAVPPVSPIEQAQGPIAVIDTATLLSSNAIIQTIRYIQLSSTPGVNKFLSSVFNDDFPTDIKSVLLELDSSPLLVTHSTPTIVTGATFSDSTDLASAQMGTELTMSISLALPPTTVDTVWILNGTDPKIDIIIRLEVAGVDSVGIRTNQTSLLPTVPDPLPLPADVQIISGQLRTGETAPINTISLTGLRNTLPFDIDFALTFPNFSTSPSGGDSLRFGPLTLSNGDPTFNETKDLAGFTFLNPAGPVAIDSFEYDVLAEIVEQDIVLPLDGSTLGAFQADFGVGDLYFDSITGNFEISFDAVNTTIENIPTGFAGFKFDRLSLTLFFHSEIDLPVVLDLELKGGSTEGDSATVPINAPVNYPSANAVNGDTANTVIVLDQNSVRTFWLPAGTMDIADAWWDTTVANASESIVDVLNLPPETITVGGAAAIQGEGVVAAGKGLWGEFKLVAPFAFLMPIDITFLPGTAFQIDPMDADTRETVQTALLSASLTSSTLMDMPIGGNISMLVSDTILFSLALDHLDEIAAGIPTMARTGDTTVYNNLIDVLAADSITGVSHIVFFPENPRAGETTDPTDTRAKLVEFYSNPGDTEPAFFIGRLFELTLPGPKSVNSLGHVTEPGDTTETLALDAERVGWIASESALFMQPLITFNGVAEVRTFQVTDSMVIEAFITFNVSSEILSTQPPADSSQITFTPPAAVNMDVGDTVFVDLADVFDPPTGAITDAAFEVTATSSHTGIAAVVVRNITTPTTTKQVRVIGIGPGTAQIALTADDDGTDDIDAVETSFLVTVSAVASPPRPPVPEITYDRKVKGL